MKKKATFTLVLTTAAFLAGTLVLNAAFSGDIFSTGKNERGGNAAFVTTNGTDLDDVNGEAFALAMDINHYSVQTKFVGVDNDYIIEPGKYGYFTNVDPVRRFDELSVSYNLLNGEQPICNAFYFSYNPLSLNDIFNGRYQDLYFANPNPVFADDQYVVTLTDNEYPQILNARYVLGLIYSNSRIQLASIGMSTPCDTEPDEQAVGQKNNFTDVEQSNIKAAFTENYMYPFVGNGSYRIDENGHLHGLTFNDGFIYDYHSLLLTDGFTRTSVDNPSSGVYVYTYIKEVNDKTLQIELIHIKDYCHTQMYEIIPSVI